MFCEDTKFSVYVICGLFFLFALVAVCSAKAVSFSKGPEQIVFITFQKTVAGLLDEMDINVEKSDRVLLKPTGFVVENLSMPFASGSNIEFEKAEPVLVQADGVTRQIHATKKNLRNVVAKLGIKLGPLDRIQFGEDPNQQGVRRSRVVRVEHKLVKRKEQIPYEIDYNPNAQVQRGKVVTWKPGSGGEREDTYRDVYEDGKLVSSTFVTTRVSQRPIHEEMAVGNGEIPGGALGMYIMESTAYTPSVDECDADPWTTATGMRSGYGIVAVDPRQIPYFTKLYIEGYGYAIAGDCGGAIKGDRIDVFFYKKQEAYRWGRRKVRVYVLEWPQKFKR